MTAGKSLLVRSVLVAAALALALAGPAFAAGSFAHGRHQGPKKEEGFQVAAPYAILIDAQSGTVLYEKNADQLMFPSSMAKLMTAELVFHQISEGGLDPQEDCLKAGQRPNGVATWDVPAETALLPAGSSVRLLLWGKGF